MSAPGGSAMRWNYRGGAAVDCRLHMPHLDPARWHRVERSARPGARSGPRRPRRVAGVFARNVARRRRRRFTISLLSTTRSRRAASSKRSPMWPSCRFRAAVRRSAPTRWIGRSAPAGWARCGWAAAATDVSKARWRSSCSIWRCSIARGQERFRREGSVSRVSHTRISRGCSTPA